MKVDKKVKPALSEPRSDPQMSDQPGPSVKLFRYPTGKIQVVTHRGKRTTQLFCQPRKNLNDLPKQDKLPSSTEISSTYSTNMFEQMETFSVVSNLSELSELSTLTNIDEDLITLKMKPNNIPQLHCAGLKYGVTDKTLKSKKQSSREKKISKSYRAHSKDLCNEEQTKVLFEEKLEERMDKLKLTYDKHVEHILQECNQKVQSLQFQLARYEIDLTEIKVKLSSSEKAEELSRKELESVTQARNWYQERLGQIQSSTDYNKSANEPPPVEEHPELHRLEEENTKLRSQLDEEEKRLTELEEIISKDKVELSHLTGVIESEKKDRDIAERRALSYENLIREAQIRIVEIKQEKDTAYHELEKLSCLTEDLEEKVDYTIGENNTISKENTELKIIIKSLKESSEMNEIRANNLEKLLTLKEDEKATLMSSLLKSDKEKQDLLQKFTSEKGELELIIEELRNVKKNIQNNINKNSDKTSEKSNELLANQEDISQSIREGELEVFKEGASKKINAKRQAEFSEKEVISQEFDKQSEKNNVQIEKNKELTSHLNKQYLQILELEASEIKLNNTIEDLKKDRDNLTLHEIAEMKDTRKKYEEMKTQIGVFQEKVEERDALVARLQEEKQKHETQLKGLHCALKTSFNHIKSLRKAIEESQQVQCLDVDNSMDQLLSSTRNMRGSSLHSLKLSLFDLKENVRELNIELGSSSVTPNISSEIESPSFLDKLQDLSDSVGETPSLQLSSHSSLNSSPAHFIT